jgi:hypothetical protein
MLVLRTTGRWRVTGNSKGIQIPPPCPLPLLTFHLSVVQEAKRMCHFPLLRLYLSVVQEAKLMQRSTSSRIVSLLCQVQPSSSALCRRRQPGGVAAVVAVAEVVAVVLQQVGRI